MKKSLFPYKLINTSTLEQLGAITKLKEAEIKSATDFVKEIEKGNLDTSYHHTGSSDISSVNGLAGSLLSMRDQMEKVAEEEKERKWTTEGLAKFVEILRADNSNLHSLSADIISSLVKYMGANQGGLFILNDENESFLELTACFAYNKKKYIEKRIELGQGLVGQAYLEKETIYITDIPQGYISITSGLGEALPNNILIVPLKVNEHVFGIVEIASFYKIHKYQIEFVEKLGESIASTISGVKINDKTRKLLTESQMQTEHMRSQEEEMRQNLEELSATQEEMQRIFKEVQIKETNLNDLINATSDSIITIDLEYKVVACNQVLKNTYSQYGMHVDKGFDVMLLFSDEQKDLYKS